MADSLHYSGLAQDWNLFVGGKYMDQDCPEWRAAGKKWEDLHPLTRWGGNWNKNGTPLEPGEGDLDHISLSWEGRA